MKPYYQVGHATIHCGDCIKVMAEMPENSVDAIEQSEEYCEMIKNRYQQMAMELDV